jgi:hypothetical protein
MGKHKMLDVEQPHKLLLALPKALVYRACVIPKELRCVEQTSPGMATAVITITSSSRHLHNSNVAVSSGDRWAFA